MFLWTNPVHELREAHRYLPADILPVLARIAELKGLWTFPAIGLPDAYGANEGVLEGEDDVSRRYLAHDSRRRSGFRWHCAWATKGIRLGPRGGRSDFGLPTNSAWK